MDLVFVGGDDDGDGQVALVFIDDGDGQVAWSSLMMMVMEFGMKENRVVMDAGTFHEWGWTLLVAMVMVMTAVVMMMMGKEIKDPVLEGIDKKSRC